MNKAAIAFLDILGFKGIWQTRESDDVLKIMGGVKDKINEIYKEPSQASNWPASENPEITILSDTIVVVIKSEEPHCLFLLANIVFGLFRYFWKHNLFLRGAVSWGEYSKYESTFIGPAIDDVATWYEAANWIGVILTPKTSYLMDRFSKLSMGVNDISVIPYLKYHVPDRAGKKHHLFSINWPAYLQASYKKVPLDGEEIDSKKMMVKMFSEQSAFNGSVLEKYENTLGFLDYSIKNLQETNR